MLVKFIVFCQLKIKRLELQVDPKNEKVKSICKMNISRVEPDESCKWSNFIGSRLSWTKKNSDWEEAKKWSNLFPNEHLNPIHLMFLYREVKKREKKERFWMIMMMKMKKLKVIRRYEKKNVQVLSMLLMVHHLASYKCYFKLIQFSPSIDYLMIMFKVSFSQFFFVIIFLV